MDLQLMDKVVIIDRDLQACDRFFAELQPVRGRGHRVIMDLQPTESCAKVAEETIRTFG